MKKFLLGILALVVLYNLFGSVLPWNTAEEIGSSTRSEQDEAPPLMQIDEENEVSQDEPIAEPLDDMADKQEDGEAEHTEHTYTVVTGDVTWEEANRQAQQSGGYLVTITSQQEQDTVCALAEQSGLTYLWLGAECINGTFAWGTGEPFAYTNWYPGEPSGTDTDGVLEPFLCMWNVGEGWSWNDQRNDIVAGYSAAAGKIGYIVEYESHESEN